MLFFSSVHDSVWCIFDIRAIPAKKNYSGAKNAIVSGGIHTLCYKSIYHFVNPSSRTFFFTFLSSERFIPAQGKKETHFHVEVELISRKNDGTFSISHLRNEPFFARLEYSYGNEQLSWVEYPLNLSHSIKKLFSWLKKNSKHF